MAPSGHLDCLGAQRGAPEFRKHKRLDASAANPLQSTDEVPKNACGPKAEVELPAQQGPKFDHEAVAYF